MEEIYTISEKHSFALPKDEKLLELIRNPFYLNEYLKFYNDTEELEYIKFKGELWNQNIKRAKPQRERCFLQIALERANKGQFFIEPSFESDILDNELVKDGILGYETPGYFITHDIYEEWALEKIIEKEFLKKTESNDFFAQIGQSLPIRRCLRNWLSEKLFLEDDDIEVFIAEVIDSQIVESFWKDEILVSVLLSDYSKIFFDIFENELLANEQKLFKRLTFILRLACKEVDDDLFKILGIKKLNLFSLELILTKPKGQGWKSIIKFIFDNLEAIGIENINFVVPIIYDWNSKVKKGQTTRFSSLIALQYYQWIINGDSYFYHNDDLIKDILNTIVYGSSEIKDELKDIFEQVIQNKWKNHRDPYSDLLEIVLTKIEGIDVAKALPEYVLKLADLFWTYTEKKDDSFYRSPIEIEQHFGLESNHHDYFPASAFQTPISWLLKFAPEKTIDFILNFTNKSVHNYAASGFDKSVHEIKVSLDNGEERKQFISHCLWNMYRGTGSPVSPYLLQSIHMALEKYFLEVGKNANSKILESKLIYLLENSESASISSVVTSIVLAYPNKTFNVAKVLFKTKEFIRYDKTRLVSEADAKSFFYDPNPRNEIYTNERIKTCEDKHRKLTLENLFVSYQLFKNEKTTAEEAETRKKILWKILDDYYQELSLKSQETESDKIWRLFLARMDLRKMEITTKQTDDSVLILFNPEIEPSLKEYSEKSLAETAQHWKYIPLKLWAKYKFRNDEKYKEYDKYENNPLLALEEVKDIIKKLEKIKRPENYNIEHSESEEESFFRDNYSIPPYVCSVLIENHLNDLSMEDKIFCKDIILKAAYSSLRPNYCYQIPDGVQPAISVLPILLKVFPENKADIKIILIFNLFNEYRVGGRSNESFSVFPIRAIHKLWEEFFSDAQSLLFGYLLLKPLYGEFTKRSIQKNYKNGIEEYYDKQLMQKFFEENKHNFQDIVDNNLPLKNLRDISILDLDTLNTAFQLIPQKTENEEHKKIVKIIISVFAERVLSKDRNEKIGYQIKYHFLRTYAYFVLNSHIDEIPNYLKPFLDNFNASESVADLFKEFILAEDILKTNEKFWLVWNIFKEKIFYICQNGERNLYVGKIVESYLFAQIPWRETAKEWHSLKDQNKRFFKEVAEKISHCPSALYAISKLLNGIGSSYIDDGINWISSILKSNKYYVDTKFETDTIYYIENLLRKFIFSNREKIKRKTDIKNKLLIILDFLIEQGSTVGYMLRESIV